MFALTFGPYHIRLTNYKGRNTRVKCKWGCVRKLEVVAANSIRELQVLSYQTFLMFSTFVSFSSFVIYACCYVIYTPYKCTCFTHCSTTLTPVLSSARPLGQYTFPTQLASLAIVPLRCGGGGGDRGMASGFLLEHPDTL